MYEEMQLPGMLGRFDRFNVHAEFAFGRGWVVTLRHRHLGDALNCTHVHEFQHLTMSELVQVVEDYCEAGAHTFTWDAENARCRSDRSG